MATALKEVTNMESTKPPANKKKRMSVERIYQKKSQLEHIILRPDSYIGSDQPTTQNMWVWDDTKEAIVSKSITYTPGLYKIFDEIIVNAADNKQRDARMNTIKVKIDQEANVISVWNNGKGIPCEMHKEEKLYVPTLIFGHLLTSSNYDDTEKKVVGGRNGFGAKLCNIFSTKFTVETASNGKKFKQVWRNNMGKAETEKIIDYTGTDFTCVTFSPDLKKFKMESLDDDFVSLIKRRAYDMAGVCKGVSVILNGDKVKVKTFKDYVNLYVKGASKDDGLPPPKVVHEIVNPRWEICVTVSDSGFQQSSFVNSIATTKGGSHIAYIVDQICEKLITAVKKKTGKGGFNIKPFQVKSHLWVFANCLIENPTFDSQTKENMTLRKTAFGSTCDLTPTYIKQVQDCGILDNILNWVRFKTEAQLMKKTSSTSKNTRLKGIPKLDDANDAGTKNSRQCTLIVTEGDSAKALAMAGLGVVGRDKYGVFPLRGKLLNVRDASHKQIMDNVEIGSLCKIIGLQFGKKYETEADMKNLRYGHLMIMADQDIDGSHIKGLVINFIHAHWPALLKLPFLEEFITPIVKVIKAKQSFSFFSIPEFEEWKNETPNHKSWRIKYYKGLGTSTSKEGKEYFSNMQRHRIVFEYDGPSCDQAMIMAFSKKLVNDRKDWLTAGMALRKMRREADLPEIYLYEKDTKTVTYTDFVNKELILFSNTDNERSIPSMVDGLKPGQRKVLFTCMKRNDKHEVKVAQLAGSIAELSAYHHGEASLMGTIVNMAQNYVGSNNLNTLVPHGQFGTRHLGGKDSASPRYICTMLSTLTRLIFPIHDDYVLKFLFEDNQKIEPEWYCPILPMILINGAEGIGTGYSTKVPNHDVREVVANIRRMIAGEDPEPMAPSYKNFNGTIERVDETKYSCFGSVNIIDDSTMEITELPIKTWTQTYKESVMDVLLYGNDKVPACITDYKEYHTDCTVKFQVSMTPEQLHKIEDEGLHKKFKLESNLLLSNIVLFDQFGCLRKYSNTVEILREFYAIRLKKYQERKEFMVGMLQAEADRLENQARFILEKIEGKIVIENKTKRDVITKLVERGFVSDPVKGWKAKVTKDSLPDDGDESEAPVTDYASSTSTTSGGPDFQYLLSMAIMSLSKERKDELLRQRDQKKEELDTLLSKSPEDLWSHDLDVFTEELDIVEEQERQDELISANIVKKSAAGRGASAKSKKAGGGRKVEVKKTFDKKPKEPSKAALKKAKDAFGFDTDSVKSEESSTTAPAAKKKVKVKEETASASAPAPTSEVTDVDAVVKEEETESSEPLSLADRLKKKKQSTLTFQPKKPAATKKKTTTTKKSSALKFSDSESDAEGDLTIDDFSDEQDDEQDDEDDDDDYEPPVKKTTATRKATKKLVIDDSDEENNSDVVADDDVDSNPDVAETRALIERLTPKKNKLTTSDSGGSGKAESGPSSAAKKDIFGFDNSVDDPIVLEDNDEEVAPSPKKTKKTAASKKETTKAKKTAGAAASKPKKSTTATEDPKQKKISFGKKPATTKKTTNLFGDTDSDIEVVSSPVKEDKPAAKKKASPKKKPAAKQSVAVKRKNKSKNSDDEENDDDEDDDEEEIKKPKKSVATKPKPAKKAKRRIGDSDEDFDGSDMSFNPTEAPLPARERGGRRAATKKKTYKFSSDEDDKDDDDDDFC